jgi:hypothetical protein
MDISSVDDDFVSWLMMNDKVFPFNDVNQKNQSSLSGNKRARIPSFSSIASEDTPLPVSNSITATSVDGNVIHVSSESVVSGDGTRIIKSATSKDLTPSQTHSSHLSGELSSKKRSKHSTEIFESIESELSVLKERMKKLETENTALKAQLRSLTLGSGDNESREAERQRHIRKIASLVGDSKESEALRLAILAYKDMHGDFGKDRWIAIKQYIAYLSKILVPNEVTRLSTTLVAESGNAGANPHHFWQEVCDYCDFTPDQKNAILSLRSEIHERKSDFVSLHQLLQDLEARITRNFQKLEYQFNVMMGNLTPLQIAKFLLWVEENRSRINSIIHHGWGSK